MTHEKLINSTWFNRAQIARAFGITHKDAGSLCDRVTDGVANGGYGMNIISAEGGDDSDAREDAAMRLAHILECDACPACGE